MFNAHNDILWISLSFSTDADKVWSVILFSAFKRNAIKESHQFCCLAASLNCLIIRLLKALFFCIFFFYIMSTSHAPYLEGVILYSHNSNAYWPEGSEYDDAQPPLCQSFDGKVGYGEPGGTCADCVLNQFDSDGNNKGKACKNMRMLYLLRSGEYMPIQIALPPTSLTPYTRFVNEAFLSRRRKVCTGVVRIGLKKAVSGGHEYCVATFTKIADFAGEDLAHIRAYADGFVAQIKDINAQRAQAGAAASSIIGDGDTSHLELPDNGAHFALGAVIDGEREELPA